MFLFAVHTFKQLPMQQSQLNIKIGIGIIEDFGSVFVKSNVNISTTTRIEETLQQTVNKWGIKARPINSYIAEYI